MTIEPQEHSEIEVGSSRSFGLVFASVFAIISFFPLINSDPIRLWALIIAIAFLAVAIVAPVILDPLNRIWFRFGILLAKVVNPIMMLLIYVVAILPMGLLLKVLGKDLLLLKFDNSSASYWIDRDPPGPEPESVEEQF